MGAALQLTRAADGRLVCEALELADRFWPRLKGLMGRAGLAPGAGLWLEPCSSIHMMFMRFPIDVVFGRRLGPAEREPGGGEDQLQVLKVCRGVRPWTGMAWCTGAEVAVELAQGGAEGLEGGDVLLRGDAARAPAAAPASEEVAP